MLYVGSGGIVSICRIKKLFSSMNWSSSVRSSKNLGKKLSSRSRLFNRMRWTAIDLLGLATKTWMSLGVDTANIYMIRDTLNT